MNLEPLKLPSLLRDFGVTPKKGLGQNFLVEDSFLRRIVETAGVDKKTEVLEIGAGAGNLTRYLAHAARAVTAVEIDVSIMPLLCKITAPFDNVNLVQEDILNLDISRLMQHSGYVVVANIPYYITSALIRFLLESDRKPSLIVLTIQEEVASRVCARPGQLSLLALSVQLYGAPRVAFKIPAGAFFPVPKVDSAVLVIDLYKQPLIAQENIDTFFHLIKAGFSQKRKMLRNTLATARGLDKERAVVLLDQAGIDPKTRAQSLAMEEWKRLTQFYQSLVGNRLGS